MGLKFQRKGLCVLHSRVVETLLTKLLTIQFEFWMHRLSYASKCSIALYLPAGRMISLSCQHSMSARLSQLCGSRSAEPLCAREPALRSGGQLSRPTVVASAAPLGQSNKIFGAVPRRLLQQQS